MATQTPLLLLDNLFDCIIQYPNAVLSASSEAVGREARYVADYRRERTWWQPTASAANHYVAVDLGVGVTGNVDSLWLDRGHNLAGQTVAVQYSDDGSAWTTLVSRAVPAAAAAVGGDPLTIFCLTEEGACYTLFAAAGIAHRYWRLLIAAAGLWQVPGIILGSRVQLLSYSHEYDDDGGMRKVRTEESDAGYVATGNVYTYRKATIDLSVIGDSQYDGQMRQIRQLMFSFACPAMVCLNFGVRPERAWLFAFDGTAWSFAKKAAYRAGKIPLREVGAVVGGLVVVAPVVSSGNPLLPPDAQSALVLAWDAVNGSIIGPAYQLGSAAGADTNDPTFVSGPPACYSFGADDYITFGDVLDATFIAAAGWTIINAFSVTSGDIAATVRVCASKDDSTIREWWVGMLSGKMRLGAYYGGGTVDYEQYDQTAALAAGRHVVGFGFDPTLARASRVQAYINGSAMAGANTSVGSNGTISDTAKPLTMGYWAASWPSPDTQRALYIYNRPLTPTEHANNRAWLVAQGWS